MFLDSIMGGLRWVRGKQTDAFSQGAGVKKKNTPMLKTCIALEETYYQCQQSQQSNILGDNNF